MFLCKGSATTRHNSPQLNGEVEELLFQPSPSKFPRAFQQATSDSQRNSHQCYNSTQNVGFRQMKADSPRRNRAVLRRRYTAPAGDISKRRRRRQETVGSELVNGEFPAPGFRVDSKLFDSSTPSPEGLQSPTTGNVLQQQQLNNIHKHSAKLPFTDAITAFSTCRTSPVSRHIVVLDHHGPLPTQQPSQAGAVETLYFDFDLII